MACFELHSDSLYSNIIHEKPKLLSNLPPSTACWIRGGRKWGCSECLIRLLHRRKSRYTVVPHDGKNSRDVVVVQEKESVVSECYVSIQDGCDGSIHDLIAHALTKIGLIDYDGIVDFVLDVLQDYHDYCRPRNYGTVTIDFVHQRVYRCYEEIAES